MQETSMCKTVQPFLKVTCQRGHRNPEMLIKLTVKFEANQTASGGVIEITKQ